MDYFELRALLGDERLPAALVDLDALDRNLTAVLDTVSAKPVRVASKSLRVVAILRRLIERGQGRLRGLMCFCCEEAEHLAGHGFDDLLVAYPAVQRSDLERVARLVQGGKQVSVVADSREGADRISDVGRAHDVRIPIVLCVDMSLELFSGRVHLGVRRSPLRDERDVVELATYVADHPGARFHGLLTYEAQVAGLGDASPFEPRMNFLKSAVKRASVRELGRRRARIVEALRARGLACRVVNGGGSGSLDTTSSESAVTEVTAGSAFFKPHLFDYYRAPHMRRLEPAAFFALEVTRRPAPGFVTCLGGGYVASGAPGPDKVPLPWLPRGLALVSAEMAGEVQTPLRVPSGVELALGDPVIFRHAKGGELCERFNEVLLVQDARVVDRVPTYRGEGKCFI